MDAGPGTGPAFPDGGEHRTREELAEDLRRYRADIAELKNRVAILENELRSKHSVNFLDVARSKRADEALQFERLQLLSIFDSIDEVIYVADPCTHEILYANRAMRDKFGKSLTGGICYREVQNKDAPCEFCTNDIILGNKGEAYRWEFHNPTVNKDFDIVDRIIKWPDGRDVRFEIALDITERKRAEQALRESEEKYRELVENANSIIIRWDTRGNLTFFNEFAEKLFGYTKNEILGRDVVGTIVPLSESSGRDLAALMEEVKRYPDHFKLNVNENVCKNGDRVWIAWTNKAICDEHGNIVEILSVGNDITERKRAEKALARDRFILTKSQEVARVGNWAFDPRTGELTGSAENDRIFGYEPGDGTRTIEWVMSRVIPEDRRALADFLEARARDGKRGSIDYRIEKPDESVGYVNTIVDKAVRDKAGNIKRLYGISQDITERKRAEEAIKAAKAQAELYLDLMGHDINNMHQVALGYLELAKDMPEGTRHAEFIDKSMEVLRRSTKLIGNVRKLQKLHDGVFYAGHVDVCKLLAAIQSEYKAVPGKTITLDLNGHDHCIVHDNELLYDVFSNLLNNAVKHTGNGEEIGIALDVIEDNGKSYCRVAVEDDGPGIPDDFKERVFNRMQKGSAMGMGLGLYLVRSLVNSFGGRVWAEDRVRGDHTKGARFVVMLPAIEK